MVVYLVYLARECAVYFVAVDSSYADSAVSLMYRTYTCSYTCKHIMRSTDVGDGGGVEFHLNHFVDGGDVCGG